jgi:hypothetical protein
MTGYAYLANDHRQVLCGGCRTESLATVIEDRFVVLPLAMSFGADGKFRVSGRARERIRLGLRPTRRPIAFPVMGGVARHPPIGWFFDGHEAMVVCPGCGADQLVNVTMLGAEPFDCLGRNAWPAWDPQISTADIYPGTRAPAPRGGVYRRSEARERRSPRRDA